MKIITISREFGSGGRELGKRLADELGIPCYDHQIIENFAKQGDCVIVGRCADVILKDYHPLNLFVYADKEAKIERCLRRAPAGEKLTRGDIERRMRQIDRGRAQYREMYADSKWGAKETYHLCISTTEKYIKEIIPGLAAYVRCWFSE